MATKGVSVGVEITGSAKGFKSASEDAARATEQLKRKSVQHSKDIERSFKDITISLAKLGGALVVAQKAFQIFEKIMNSTQASGDDLTLALAGAKEAVNTLAQNLATGDFSINIRDAAQAAKDLENTLDDIADRERSLSIISAKNKFDMTVQQGILRNMGATEKQRAVAADKILSIVEDETKLREDMLNESLQGFKDFDIKKYKLSQQQADLVQQYIADYSRFTEEQQTALSNAGMAQIRLNALESQYQRGLLNETELRLETSSKTGDLRIKTAAVIPELRKYIPIWRPINDLVDKHRDAIAQVSVNWWNNRTAMQSYSNSAERALSIDKPVGFVGEPYKRVLKGVYPDIKAAQEQIDELNETLDKTYLYLIRLNTPSSTWTNVNKDLLRTITAGETLKNQLEEVIQDYKDEATAIISATNAFKAYAAARNAPIGPQDNGGNVMTFPFKAPSTGGSQPILGMSKELQNQIELVNSLESAFESMFSNIDGGIEEMGKAFVKAIEMMAAEIAARAALFLLITVITGGTGELFKAMGTFSDFALRGFKDMASGGVVYGPTLANVGEYANASTNPEVVAPLSKLKGMLGGDTINVKVTGKLQGKDIYLSAERYSKLLNKAT